MDWLPITMSKCSSGYESVERFSIRVAIVFFPKYSGCRSTASYCAPTSWQRFWSVTFPHILPILLVATLFSFVVTLGDFQIVWLLTKGGPQNATHLIATLAFRTAIRGANIAKGAAIASFLFPFLVIVIALQVRFLRNRS